MSPLDILLFFWGTWGTGSGKGCWYDYVILAKVGYWYNDYTFFFFFPISQCFLIPLPGAVVTEPGLQLQMLEAGMILKQDTVTML